VANVGRFVGRIESLPTWITPSEGGEGFMQAARHLLAARAA